ncbi:hypothetical protein BY457_102254 [Marinilabilia salmonicolor]|jgi:hypothetical protein|uniref:DUF6452 family protein n=1 Tax=Marinilabilia salmonicolor TaxID=989 RepID=UPI000D062278|nr:DUF6452 family protein [Marinilabilia salmonicolor]PRZ01846.1 hypothetical protein BY457_102254 [Marinilabilia salmonicolor]
MKLLTGLSALCLMVLLVSPGCEGEEACLSNQHAVQARLYSAWSTSDKDSTLENVSLIGIDMSDSIYREQRLSELFMPLNFESDTSTFVLGVSETLKDTLSIVYSKELDFISRDCGYVFTFDLDTILYSRSIIDSVSIAYPTVKYGESTANIKLYIY